MVAEDFSAFSESIPGFYFFLGVKPPGRKTMPPLHSPNFNPDERSIALGIRICCGLLLKGLELSDPLEGSGF
jgi:amidohydrolase